MSRKRPHRPAGHKKSKHKADRRKTRGQKRSVEDRRETALRGQEKRVMKADRKMVRMAALAAAAKLDEEYGDQWRTDPLLVAKFERVITEEYEATKHHGLVVSSDQDRLREKVFGAGLSATPE